MVHAQSKSLFLSLIKTTLPLFISRAGVSEHGGNSGGLVDRLEAARR